jgi:hypothetical protein
LVNVVTEIRSFYSIKEIDEALEGEIEQYTCVADEYSQWLGSLLRDPESKQERDEWTKKIALLQKGKPRGKPRKEKKKGKSKGAQTSPEWIRFNELMLSASEQGEAEILFDAIEEIYKKVERLGKVKEALGQLEKSGLGKDLIYVTYIRDGVPEKIVLRHEKDQEFAKKFQYFADFSVTTVT